MLEDFIKRLNYLEKCVQYSGTFDGIVIDTLDPEKKYRIKAKIDTVFGAHETDWAIPIMINTGILFLPKIGDKVKIMFQGSNPSKPEYLGVFYDEEKIPFKEEEDIQKVRKIKTDKHLIIFDDDKNKIIIRTEKHSVTLDVGSEKVIVNSPFVVLGGEEKEQAVLGNTLADLLKEILRWLKTHSHPISSPAVQVPQLPVIERKVDKILSEVVKVD